MSIPVTSTELEELLRAVGSDIIRAYRDKYFPARIIQACPNIYTVDNAASWVKPDKFCAFVAQVLQEQSPPPPQTPTTPPPTRPVEFGSDSENINPPLKHVRAVSLSAEGSVQASFSGDSFESGDSDNNGAGGTMSVSIGRKRKREWAEKPRAPKPSTKLAAGLIRVTRQSWVNHVETRTEAPENWRVPESGHSVAYVLDLTGDPHGYKDAKGRDLAMSAIIKHKCTDGWGGGSGGSLSKPTTVSILGGDVKCQKISHECRGAFVCSMSAPNLWDGYRRYDHDFETSPAAWQPTNECDETDSYAHIKQALRFYNNVIKEKCSFDNGKCPGRPVLKLRDQVSTDGKYHFILCSAWTPESMEHHHFTREIPRQIDEEVLRQLFTTGRNNLSDTIVSVMPCTFRVPPRTGLKQKYCPHIHIQGGRMVEGVIQHRPCPAKITIFSPVDHTLRKAAVIPASGVPHNHPSHPSDKLTRRAKAALRAAGVMESSTTPTSCIVDCASSSPSIDGGECGISQSAQQMGCAGPPPNSMPAITPGSSISTAFMPNGYHLDQFY